MASLVSFMDTALNTEQRKVGADERKATAMAYGGMALVTLLIICLFTEFDFSAVQTVSAGLMLLAFLVLAIKIHASGSAEGVSSKTLEMYLVTLLIRLMSTTLKRGYLPIDSTGNFIYQTFDVSTVVVLMRLIYSMQREFRATYQVEDDLHSIFGTLPISALIAMFFHANLNRSFFFDTIWMTAHILEAFALLPQLYMISRKPGKVETCTAHFVALMVLSRVFAWLFWFYGYPELADGYIENVFAGHSNWGGYTIIAASTLQLALSADFMYYYLKATLAGRPVVINIDV
jgi:uncharacterized protein with PQ loop repeat